MMGPVSLTDRRATELPASPRATRHRVSAWRDPRLLVGVVLVAGSGLLGATLLSDDATVAVWATRDAVAAGEPVRADALVRREVRFADQADADRYVSAGDPLPTGATLSRDVGLGELLPRAAIAPDPEAPAVEVPLRVAVEALPATVRTGSVVDVWVTPSPDRATATGPEPAAKLVLRDVRVLAVSRGGGALGAAAERQVIVGLDETEEVDLPGTLADMARGDVVLVRRP
jgi:Flp pilus assembly protein CpaB